MPVTAPERPPLTWLLGYRVLGLRLPERYRPWVAEDVRSRYFLAWRIGRTTLWLWALVCLYYVAQSATYQPPARRTFVQAMLAALAVALLSSGRTLVRRTLRWQRVDRHGNHVEPRGLSRLDTVESLVFASAVLVSLVGSMSVFANALRPSGPAGAPCRAPSDETESMIRGGFKPGAEMVKARAVSYGDQTMVAAVVRVPEGEPPERAHVWIVRGGSVYELRTPEQSEESATTFAPPPDVDRVGVEALRRVVLCLTQERGR